MSAAFSSLEGLPPERQLIGAKILLGATSVTALLFGLMIETEEKYTDYDSGRRCGGSFCENTRTNSSMETLQNLMFVTGGLGLVLTFVL